MSIAQFVFYICTLRQVRETEASQRIGGEPVYGAAALSYAEYSAADAAYTDGSLAVTTGIFPEGGEYTLTVEATGFTQALEFSLPLEK